MPIKLRNFLQRYLDQREIEESISNEHIMILTNPKIVADGYLRICSLKPLPANGEAFLFDLIVRERHG